MTAATPPRAGYGGARGHRAAPGRGIVLMLVGTLLLTLNDALVKLLTDHYPVGQVMFARGIVALGLLAGWTLLAAGPSALRVHSWRGVLGRGALMAFSTYLFVTGLHHLPLADVIAVTFAGPLVTAALGVPLLRERIGPRRAVAILAGFLGVLVMVRPTGEVVQWAILLPLAATICGAFRDLLTRHLAAQESSLAILAYSTAMVTLGGLASWPLGWAPWRADDLLPLAGVGALLVAAHFLQIEAFRCAAASLIAPYRYSGLLWAALLGFLMWGDVPGPSMLLGTALVVAAGLYLWRRGGA